MRGKTAGGLVFTDWRRQCLHHGNSKNARNWTEILHGWLQFAASIAVRTDYMKHLRLTVSAIFRTVCTSFTGVVFYYYVKALLDKPVRPLAKRQQPISKPMTRRFTIIELVIFRDKSNKKTFKMFLRWSADTSLGGPWFMIAGALHFVGWGTARDLCLWGPTNPWLDWQDWLDQQAFEDQSDPLVVGHVPEAIPDTDTDH